MTKPSRRFIACIVAAILFQGLPALAKDNLAARKEAGEVTVGIHNRAPWGFVDKDGKVAGFHPDLVRAALKPLGISKIDFVVTTFGALIPGLQAHRFDMIASGIAITPKRCKQVIFSEPDLSVGDAVIVKKGNPLKVHSFADIKNNPKFRLSGGRGTLNTKDALAAGIPKDRVLQFPSGQETLSAVLAGRVDGSVMSAPTAMMMLKDPNLSGLQRVTPFTGLKRKNGTEAALYTAIAFRPDDGQLRSAYNKRLARMKADGTVAKIMKRYGFTKDDRAPELTTKQICNGQ